jgi:alpha-methylacyl-CoA racemase
VKVIELAGIGPAPFCAMLLADMGADVLRIDRAAAIDLGLGMPPERDMLNRGKRSVAVDLKSTGGRALVLRLVASADILIEGFRPGVTERLDLGPEDCWRVNTRLVYGRMTGWGQTGPLKDAAGHDLNYIALAGALHAIGRKDGPPAVPLNLIGDFGGGALYLAMGVLAALLEARSSGKGQIVDAAMVDGVANLMTIFHALAGTGAWTTARGSNVLDGGAPYYDVYETKDGRHVTVAAIEGRFYRELLDKVGLAGEPLPAQHDRDGWSEIRARLTGIFKSRTRAEWCAILEGSDACFAPVLDMDEAAQHPHLAARGTFTEVAGIRTPAPAPRFSRTESKIGGPPPEPGRDNTTALADWGLTSDEIAAARRSRTIG